MSDLLRRYPPCISFPAWNYLSQWTQHIPFAFWLLPLLEPRLLVELGVWYGTSYHAFCQSIAANDLATRAYGIDTWESDPHTRSYSPEVEGIVRNYHDARYSTFSALVHKTFDEALDDFGDGSIDLLHVDGYHTVESARHDFETWLPKLSDRAVVLFHDTAVRRGDFGVWKVWKELRRDYPGFAFVHGCGLGVLAVGPQTPPIIRAILDQPAQEFTAMRKTFHQLGRRIETAIHICKR